MKRKPKSAFINTLCLTLSLAALSACDSIRWPHIYGPDEVPQSVRDAPRPIMSPPPVAEDAAYPRLGDVPSRPKTFTPQADIDKTKQQMDQDREEAERLKERAGTPATP